MRTQPTDYRSNERLQKTKKTFLYIFNYGGELFHLTNYDQDIVVTGMPSDKGTNPQTFTSCQIRHGSSEQSTELNSPKLNVGVAINSSAAANKLKQFFIIAKTTRLDVTVLNVNSTALPGSLTWGVDQYGFFRGVKTGLVFTEYGISVDFVNLMLNEDGQVPRFFYQKLCQHPLYSVYCGVDKTDPDNFVTTTITALDRVNRWIDIADSAINGHLITGDIQFSGGYLQELDGSSNVTNQIFIVANDPAIPGTVITLPRIYLMGWSSTLIVGEAVKVFRGCRKTTAACISFDNLPNFGGTPYIPDSNPGVDGIPT